MQPWRRRDREMATLIARIAAAVIVAGSCLSLADAAEHPGSAAVLSDAQIERRLDFIEQRLDGPVGISGAGLRPDRSEAGMVRISGGRRVACGFVLRTWLGGAYSPSLL